MNIHQLNESLRDSEILRNSDNGDFNISRSFKVSKHIGLSEEQSNAAQRIYDRLNELVPDDFEFELSMDAEHDPLFSLEYADGAMTGFFGGLDFKSEEELFEKLEAKDWDEERAGAIQGCGMFDTMLEEAKERPLVVPTIKQLQKMCRGMLKEFHKTAKAKKDDIAVLFASADEDGQVSVDAEPYGMDSNLVGILMDNAACQRYPVSICIGGKPMPRKELQKLLNGSIQNLTGISRAKAEGRLF